MLARDKLIAISPGFPSGTPARLRMAQITDVVPSAAENSAAVLAALVQHPKFKNLLTTARFLGLK